MSLLAKDQPKGMSQSAYEAQKASLLAEAKTMTTEDIKDFMAKTNEATRFKPKPPEEKMVRRQVYLRPDQAAWLALEAEQSKVMRDALDEWRDRHAPSTDDTDYSAALNAMAAEPAEIDEE